MRAYLPEDTASQGYATLLEWSNIYYDPSQRKLFGGKKTTARIGCVQWKMRTLKNVEDLLQQAEYFVDALSDYRCDVAVFPEFFNAPLMGLDSHQSTFEAIRYLASYSDGIRDALSKMAVSYNINIVAGSLPLLDGKELFNVAYLCRRDGTLDAQYKLHPTPHEKKDWAMQGSHI